MASARLDFPPTGLHSRHKKRGGVSTLMYAAQQGDVDAIHKIINEQPNQLDLRDRTGKSPLHYCCTSDSIRAAQSADLLLMAAPDLVEEQDEDGFTPLHLAVIAGNTPLVTFLLANKADVRAVDNEKHTVVHWAAVCGETSALQAVIAAGAPVSTPDVHGGYPLHYAAQMCGGDKDTQLGLQVLQTLLVHKDISVAVQDEDGRQPLLWAASAGSSKAVLALVRAGANVESADKDGLTALHCAASRGHTDSLDSLLTLCGATTDVIDSNGCTALHYAVTLGHADATALLLAHGADANRQDRKGRSPAHCGCAKGQLETVKMIGAHGANLWLKNARGDLSLHEATASGRRELVQWLLELRPSNVNARNNDGRCPLHLAALHDNADMCKILLDAGSQVNPVLRTSKNGFMTPLDCALQRGFRSTAKYLQLHGGIPASRLGSKPPDLRKQPQNVVEPGYSSSETELEVEKKLKKVPRRKLFQKYEKKRPSLLESDLDSEKSLGQKHRKLFDKTRRSRISSSETTSSMEHPGGRKTSLKKIGYGNEIVINGNTEINIHQSKQIVLTDKEPDSKEPKKEVGTELSQNICKEPSKIEVNAKEDTIVPVYDRGSNSSNTSDEAMEQTKLVVEAAVHETPKLELIETGIQVEIVEQVRNEAIGVQTETEEVEQKKKPEEFQLLEVTEATKLEQSVDRHFNQEESNNKIELKKSHKGLEKPEEIIENNNEQKELTIGAKDTDDEDILSNEKNETEDHVLEEINKKTEEKLENQDDIVSKPKDEPLSKNEAQEDTLTENKEESETKKEDIDNIEKKIPEKTEPEPKLEDQEENNNKVKENQSTTENRTDPAYEIIYKTIGDDGLLSNDSDSESSSSVVKDHKSFTVISDEEVKMRHRRAKPQKHQLEVPRHETKSNLESRVPSLPNINRPDSNLSAPLLGYSDRSASDQENEDTKSRKKRKVKKRAKKRNAESDYESNVIDSGFEPSPRSSRVLKGRNMSERGVNMSSVTQSMQSNIRRYHLERKIFQHLLELKRLQIRAGQHNEVVLVKRAIEAYHRSCAATVGAGRYHPADYSFKNFEKFLYQALRKLQRNGAEHLKGLPEAATNPLLCTQSTHRCMHATHAYTGIPCAAYLPKMDHHSIPKIGFGSCKPGGGFLPTIKKEVTLELCHGEEKQVISLPADRLDQNKRYYVTFTVKENEKDGGQKGHIHAKSN